jgi:hypothetical protein
VHADWLPHQVRNQIEQAIKRQEERLSMLIDGGETPSAEMATTISREDALVRRPLMSNDDLTDEH